MVGFSKKAVASRQQAALMESPRIDLDPEHLKFHAWTKLRREKMIQLLPWMIGKFMQSRADAMTDVIHSVAELR